MDEENKVITTLLFPIILFELGMYVIAGIIGIGIFSLVAIYVLVSNGLGNIQIKGD